MPFGEHLQRRRAALVSWLALAVAVGGVVTYAVQADGYQAHRADLNDGGIWVTSKHDGSYGRINKPIGELDGTVFSSPDSNLDIVQDGDSVVGVNLSDGVVVPLDPAQMKVPDGEEAAIPGSPVVGMAGGSLAVLDASTGDLWAAREDPEVGVPSVTTLADQADPLAEVGEDAAMAVTLDGTVLAASATEDRLLTLRQQGDTGFLEATTQDLPGDAVSDAIALTAVGARARRPRLGQRPAPRHRRRRRRGAPGLGPAASRSQRVRGPGRRTRRAAVGRPGHRQGDDRDR